MFRRCASFFKSYGVKHYSKMTDWSETDNIFTLTLKGEGQNAHLLTRDLVNSFSSDLKEVKSRARSGSVLITTAEGVNFCKGFPKDGRDEVIVPFRELVKDLISLPMPTIAAINGEAKCAGLILAMSHDHLTMEPNNSVLFMMDSDNKMPLPEYFTAMIRSKVVPGAFARLASNTSGFNSKHAEQMGLVVQQREAENEKPLRTAENFASYLSKKNWDGNMYAEIRKTLYPDLCSVLGITCAPSSRL